ncbi:MAG: protein-(glutamine-N5) methyltransferase, release factor-specific [Chloroflexi bacterium RIFOXYD12_FULL_57_15]|nr:MAG: protein-(glutamine-N5) methyltransferase, release factor-specific [Chloroflexi bacterium RIFOXYD12_FULL_57_15]
MNVHSTLEQTSDRLRALTDTPDLDAQVLLAHLTGKPRTWLAAHPETPLSGPELDSARQALSALEAGTPLPYILGHWEFFGLDFEITPDVLIPRPETELLVEQAILWLQASPKRRTVADIGAGSGAIAVSIAMNVPDARVLATDISRAALEVAKHNAQKFNLQDRIEFVECDLLPESKVEGQRSDLRPLTFDLICANLPYIPTATLEHLPIYGREPTLALDGGNDGLDPIRHLLKIAPEWLAPEGLILLEIEATLGAQALSLAHDKFPSARIALHSDLSGKDRLIEIALS